MKISIIGTGYVGLVQGTCFAESGNTVLCMDVDAEKIRALNEGNISIYEVGLEEMVRRNLKEGRLSFSGSLEDAILGRDIIFLCLPTPQKADGGADCSRIFEVSAEIARRAEREKILVCKSTAPVGTVRAVRSIIQEQARVPIEVVANPEFLREGTAVQDCLKPDRIIIGTTSPHAASVLRHLYEPFVRTGNPILVMDPESAEMTKYAANAFLAARISFMNELANLCEHVGADIDEVRKGMSLDHRIGKYFLFPGVGYGGSCFPKDVRAMIRMGEERGVPLHILRSVELVNEQQKQLLVQKIAKHFSYHMSNRTIALWGLSFKPGTNDIREAPSLRIIDELLKMGARVQAHDPVANKAVQAIYQDRITLFDNNYDALTDADALVIITEWNEYRSPDFAAMKRRMRQPILFDGRNIFNREEIAEQGFVYYGIGRQYPRERQKQVSPPGSG
jgi:UDPglucose 6-dehydrogenase